MRRPVRSWPPTSARGPAPRARTGPTGTATTAPSARAAAVTGGGAVGEPPPGAGEGARFARADVTDEESTQGALDAARDAFGGLHGLVNCAGIGPAEKVVGKRGVHSLDSFVKAVQINLVGTFNPIRLAVLIMIENEPNEDGERGVIVNTASVAAFDGQIGQAAYSASKGGVASMTLPVAREMAGHGIRVMTIARGE